MPVEFKSGWLPDLPDHRDIPYSELRPANRLFRAVQRPSAIDLRIDQCLPAVFHQGHIGSCVANAWSAALAYRLAKEGAGPMVLSRLFIYYHARGGVPEDRGAYIRDGIKGVAQYGAPLESVWPYVEARWRAKPSDEAYKEAEHRKEGLVYYRLNSMSDILDCLAQRYPVVYGMRIFSSFEDFGPDYTIRMPSPSDRPEGGHAMLMSGYSMKRRTALVLNSWGAKWGMGGFCRVPFDYIEALASDFWTVRDATA